VTSSRAASNIPLSQLPPAYWDSAAQNWDRVLRNPKSPHRIYYYEADRCISDGLRRRMQILEVGCGTGASTLTHAREVRRLVAMDLSAAMAKRTLAKVLRRRLGGRVYLVQAEAMALPFADSAFDAVIGRGVALSYVSDPRRALKEFRRVLRPGGRLLIDVMNRLDRRELSPAVPQHRTFRYWTMMGKEPAYVELRNLSGRQVRRMYLLGPGSPYLNRAQRQRTCRKRPKHLRRYTRAVRVFHVREFSPKDLYRLLRGAGFRGPKLTPLGHIWHATQTGDPRIVRFVEKNRQSLSELALTLRRHLRIESALHLFVESQRT
jgi:ubiquinone/menaquinone biosynthesis C-methylase UbiE